MPRQKSSPHTVTGDAKEALNLILNLRAAGAVPTTITVGTVTVELQSTAPTAGRPVERDARQAIYQQFGGEAYRRMMGTRGADAVPGEDFQPALETEQ